jgi:ABC-2 type transport system ATP-binding protein
VLEIRGLTKRFGDLTALDDASFEARPGRIVGFLGPNGAGKTTAMRAVFGLVQPEAGEILWQGQPVDTTTRLSFGYMPEERGLYPKMKIGDQLTYLARLSGLPPKRAAEASTDWLGRLGLADRAGARIEQLSHGNKQRVQLAAALVHGPALAVLDEPFSGLDPLGTDALARELRRLAADGTSIVFSSHQLDLVQDVCQDVVIIDHGRVVRTGTLEQLRAGSRVRRVEVEVDGRRWVPGSAELSVVDGDRHGLVPADTDMEKVLAEAHQAGTVTSFAFEPPSLSDLFREAVVR